jgi:hypothetical protein
MKDLQFLHKENHFLLWQRPLVAHQHDGQRRGDGDHRVHSLGRRTLFHRSSLVRFATAFLERTSVNPCSPLNSLKLLLLKH